METSASKEELSLALNPIIGYFDPLGLATADFWSMGNDATWGWLRHAEIKHGRVSMFAFVGYCAQANGAKFGFPLSLPEETNAQYADGLSPPEQWDALSLEGKVCNHICNHICNRPSSGTRSRSRARCVTTSVTTSVTARAVGRALARGQGVCGGNVVWGERREHTHKHTQTLSDAPP